MKPYPLELLNHFTVPCTAIALLKTRGIGRTIEEHAEGAANCETRGVYQNETLSQVFAEMALPAIMHKYSPSKIDLSGPLTLPLRREKAQVIQQTSDRFCVTDLACADHRFHLRRRERLRC